MKQQLTLSLILLIGICTWSCTGLKKVNKKDSTKELVSLMTGSFSSAKQAKKDTSFYNISLQMYPIWENRKDGKWLYVEQSVSKKPKKPYRQRVYKIEKVDDELFRSIVYTLPNPEDFIGKWKTPSAFDVINPDNLALKDGCDVYLRRVADKYYRGATKEGTCKSTLDGSNYATSEVEIFADKVISWDRGFNEKSEQVWGAEKGGYIFNRLK